jgi:RNA polymerase sigma factor (sigma-70 family)
VRIACCEDAGARENEVPIFKTDPDLLHAFRAGDRRALETVYRFYVQRIERYVRSLGRSTSTGILGHPSAVADLLQDIFIRAFSDGGRRAYDGLRDYGPYLATIARNCFIDLHRSSGREVVISPDELVDVADDSVVEPYGGVDPKISVVVAKYLESLVGDERGVYEQRFVLGRSQEETSATLELSRRAVRTAEKRLRVGLRKALVRAGISLRELDRTVEDSSTKSESSTVLVGGLS